MIFEFANQNFQFAAPNFLWLLLLVPLVAMLRGGKGRTAAVRFPATALARQIASFVRSRPGRFMFSLRLLVLALLILALARPQLGNRTSEIEASGIDIVLALDLSGSMWAHDFELQGKMADRLSAAKEEVEKFILDRPNDRIGLIAFANQPYMISPLTLNHGWLLQNLDRLRIGLIEDGTAIGTALAVSVNRLRRLTAKSRVIILLTDGANNSGKISPIAAAEAAAAYNIKVYTIGVGREGDVPYPLVDQEGNVVLDRQGRKRIQYLPSDLDEETLMEIAQKTDGQFFRATDTRSLQKIYKEIDQLEKSDVKMKYRDDFNDIFMWPALAGLLLLGAEQLLTNTRYRRLP